MRPSREIARSILESFKVGEEFNAKDIEGDRRHVSGALRYLHNKKRITQVAKDPYSGVSTWRLEDATTINYYL